MSIISCIKSDSPQVFRRIYMKRRNTSGEYESNWQRIPDSYIVQWGNIQYGIDDIKANYFSHSGFNFTLQNVDGYFSDQYDSKSFWYGYLTRYKTLIKVEAGYIDSDGTELPTNPSLFIGILNESMPYKENALIQFQVDHLTKIFQEFPADRLNNMVATTTGYTASEIITKIKNNPDPMGVYIFQKYITTTSWFIETTTNQYLISTDTSLQGSSCWDLMKKLAESENKLMYIDESGNFHFTSKTPASTISYHFSGINDSDRTYGKNVLEQIELSENIEQVYNRIKIQFGSSDTTTGYYIKNETWQWGDSSSSFLYGVREYEYQNEWINTATAQTIADSIYNEYKWPKQKTTMKAKFVPQLTINDRVTITYVTLLYVGTYLWGQFLWGHALWGRRSGHNINLDVTAFQIWNLNHNLENFSTQLILRGI